MDKDNKKVGKLFIKLLNSSCKFWDGCKLYKFTSKKYIRSSWKITNSEWFSSNPKISILHGKFCQNQRLGVMFTLLQDTRSLLK